MKNHLVKGVVLVLSITAVGAYVWTASRNRDLPDPPPGVVDGVAQPDGKDAAGIAAKDGEGEKIDEMLGSSKFMRIVGEDEIKEMVGDKEPGQAGSPPPAELTVTDEEVKATRERMMFSSKSGVIMSEEDVRKMLEEQMKAKAALPDPEEQDPSAGKPEE